MTLVNQSTRAKREAKGVLVNQPPRAKREAQGIFVVLQTQAKHEAKGMLVHRVNLLAREKREAEGNFCRA